MVAILTVKFGTAYECMIASKSISTDARRTPQGPMTAVPTLENLALYLNLALTAKGDLQGGAQ